MFKSLFGGGQAELRLTDDDYFISRQILFVQPPKQNYNTYLYYGGERALSAIAHYLAILKVGQQLFVILGRSVAALDLANVIRYTIS